MPRKLPWMACAGGSPLVSSSKRPATAPKPPPKRAKVSEPASDSNVESSPVSLRKQKPQSREVRTPPTSSPPEHLPESFMHEGMEHDDKYRIVEDEFLAVAQRFTVHLHAAEYKRQEKLAKARNAETINSISRPVTGKMPDHTKRKVEGIARSKTQQNTIQRLLGKKTVAGEDPYDSSDGEGLAYSKTTLRGLMDRPQRKAVSLSKLPPGGATRAAAGFQKPAAQLRQDQSQAHESLKSTSSLQLGQPAEPNLDSSTDSSDLDDDLDALVPVSRASLDKRPLSSSNSRSSLPSHATEPSRSVNIPERAAPNSSSYADKSSLGTGRVTAGSVQTSSNDAVSRVRQRLMHARLQDVKQEKGDQDKRKLDLIPTFL